MAMFNYPRLEIEIQTTQENEDPHSAGLHQGWQGGAVLELILASQWLQNHSILRNHRIDHILIIIFDTFFIIEFIFWLIDHYILIICWS